jgi:hypothetical protein
MAKNFQWGIYQVAYTYTYTVTYSCHFHTVDMPNAILLDVTNCKWLNDSTFSPRIQCVIRTFLRYLKHICKATNIRLFLLLSVSLHADGFGTRVLHKHANIHRGYRDIWIFYFWTWSLRQHTTWNNLHSATYNCNPTETALLSTRYFCNPSSIRFDKFQTHTHLKIQVEGIKE